MAKKQTRRSISLNGGIYRLARAAADRDGKTASHWITDLIREALAKTGVNVPAKTHATPSIATLAAVGRYKRQRRRVPSLMTVIREDGL